MSPNREERERSASGEEGKSRPFFASARFGYDDGTDPERDPLQSQDGAVFLVITFTALSWFIGLKVFLPCRAVLYLYFVLVFFEYIYTSPLRRDVAAVQRVPDRRGREQAQDRQQYVEHDVRVVQPRPLQRQPTVGAF